MALPLLVEDLDVCQVRVHTQAKVRRQRPRGRGPCQERRVRLVDQGEGHRDGRVLHILVVAAGLKVGQRRGAPVRVGHHTHATVHEALFVERLEHPPDALHEARVHGLVPVVKVDPAPHALHGCAPLLLVAHHNGTALAVVLGDAHAHDVVLARDAELLVDLVLHGQAVAVPAKAPVHIVPARGGEPGHNVLHCACEQVAVVRQARGERRPVVEAERLLVLGQLQLRLEGIDRVPVRDHLLLLLSKIERCARCGSVRACRGAPRTIVLGEHGLRLAGHAGALAKKRTRLRRFLQRDSRGLLGARTFAWRPRAQTPGGPKQASQPLPHRG